MGDAKDGEDSEAENCEDVEEWKTWYAERDDAAEEGDSVGWDELGESYQKADLKRGGPADWRKSGAICQRLNIRDENAKGNLRPHNISGQDEK